MGNWDACRHILVIRADNMGDVLMSSPAIRAIRERFKAKITLLSSKSGIEVGRLLPEVDDVLEFEMPWVKTEISNRNKSLTELTTKLRRGNFDGCIIFTVYSQNSLPAAMLALAAEIPLRLAYCRENPYGLLSDWVPDQEPLSFIRHQVERDLFLVSTIGAIPSAKDIALPTHSTTLATAQEKLEAIGLKPEKEYLILHPGVSEPKRYFSKLGWINCAKKLIEEFQMPLVLTGTETEKDFLVQLSTEIGSLAYVAGGLFNLEEFVAIIAKARLIISVNTGTVHLAAAVKTPIVVLYARTNPQHHPWMVPNIVLDYSIAEEQKSKNQVIRYVDQTVYAQYKPIPTSDEIVEAVSTLLESTPPQQVPDDNLD
jgi:ADP-heptose:LPS heptosyltransferase